MVTRQADEAISDERFLDPAWWHTYRFSEVEADGGLSPEVYELIQGSRGRFDRPVMAREPGQRVRQFIVESIPKDDDRWDHFVAGEEGDLVGYFVVVVKQDEDGGESVAYPEKDGPHGGSMVWVDPDHRGQGLATRLYQYASGEEFETDG